MARNEEKAQSMLYRFREAQAAELGLIRKKERRPGMASTVTSVGECERWRREVLGEVSRKVSKIQDVSLSDYQVRDLNDEINKLMREKYHWERRIRDLGGADYTRSAPKMLDHEGKEVPGNRGYKYFGRARDLPGVRELFEQEAPEPVSRSRSEIYRNIDADYYGYRDEEDGALIEYETEQENNLTERVLKSIEEQANEEEETEQDDATKAVELEQLVSDAFVPNQKQIEEYLVNRRRQQLLDTYVSADLQQNEQETRELVGQ
ncbi:pre-mRNA-splicing factor ISY1 [Spinellus fusiger]|nr:pre-mRNA-splicing factor ISY1 [Spinellus fusiger]